MAVVKVPQQVFDYRICEGIAAL